MNRLILFAHFDAANRVRPYIVDHLRALNALGGEIHFVSNSPLPESETIRITPFVHRVLLRENTGFDFSMWKAAMEGLDLTAYDEVLLTNSSITAPLHPLEPLLKRMADVSCDFWGLTAYDRPVPHIQSYFLMFRPQVFQSKAFEAFWAGVLPYKRKEGTIHAYELGLTLFLRDSGFTGVAAFPSEQLPQGCLNDFWMGRKPRFHVRQGVNPTLYYGDLLLRAGMPYLKVELLKRNPYKIRLKRLQRLAQSRQFDPATLS
jgi:lipopolysaccharide biosynthesis protein